MEMFYPLIATKYLIELASFDDLSTRIELLSISFTLHILKHQPDELQIFVI